MKTLISLALLLYLFLCSAAQASGLPELGNPANRKLSLKQERIIGQEFYRNLLSKNYVLNDPETTTYLRHIGNTLVNQLEGAAQPFTFFLVKDGGINAFATPGGYIGVNAGLIAASRSEDELAGVLAHEIAHVHQRHIARRLLDMQSSQTLTLATIFAGILAASQGYGKEASALFYGGAAAQQQLAINFTRENEIEADRIGIKLLNDVNYNPEGLISFFKLLQQKKSGKNLSLYKHLLTHPLDRIRIAEAENRIAQLGKPKQSLSELNDDYFYMHARISALNSNNAKVLLKREQTKNDSSIHGLYKLAQAYEVNQQWQAAQKIYIKLLKQRTNIPLVLGMSRCHLQLNQANQAIALLEKNLKTKPDHFALNMYYAQALLNNGQAELAITQANKMLRQNENTTPQVYRLLSRAYKVNQQDYMAQKTQVEYLYQNGSYKSAIDLLRNLIRNTKTVSIEKQILEVRLKQIIATQEAVDNIS